MSVAVSLFMVATDVVYVPKRVINWGQGMWVGWVTRIGTRVRVSCEDYGADSPKYQLVTRKRYIRMSLYGLTFI